MILAWVLASSIASAEGINLYWNDCSLGLTARSNQDFACDTNAGTNTLACSFDPPAGLDVPGVSAVTGCIVTVDLTSAVGSMSPWWQFRNARTCRLASLAANAEFSQGSCVDPWNGQGSALIATYLTNFGGDPGRARIAGAAFVPTISAGLVSPGTEYHAMNITINNQKTVGTDACAGCAGSICIVLRDIRLTQPTGTPGGSPVLTNPLASSQVGWHGGFLDDCGTCTGFGVEDHLCPTLPRTWGAIKGLYR